MCAKYRNAVIYLLKDENDTYDNDIYIGSTINLKMRILKHKSEIRINKTKKTKKTIYFNKKNKVLVYEILLGYNCNNRLELIKKEAELIKIINPTLNSISAYNTIEEKKMYDKKFNKNYYQNHREILLEKANNRYKKIKEINLIKKTICNVILLVVLIYILVIILLLKIGSDEIDIRKIKVSI